MRYDRPCTMQPNRGFGLRGGPMLVGNGRSLAREKQQWQSGASSSRTTETRITRGGLGLQSSFQGFNVSGLGIHS